MHCPMWIVIAGAQIRSPQTWATTNPHSINLHHSDFEGPLTTFNPNGSECVAIISIRVPWLSPITARLGEASALVASRDQ